MSSVEQAAYFWSYIVLENSSNNQFDDYGMEHPFQGMFRDYHRE